MSKELSKTQKGLLIGLGVGVAAPAAIVGGLALVGFGAGGVVAGSIAAAIQSSIGSVAAGSAFASMFRILKPMFLFKIQTFE